MTDRDRELLALVFGEGVVKVRCDGTYLCECPACIDERHDRIVNLRRKPAAKQPWETLAA